MNEMRRAIGTSIRSARCELRRSLQCSANRNETENDKGMDSDAIIGRLDESIEALNNTLDSYDRPSCYNDGDKDDDEDDDNADEDDGNVDEDVSSTNDEERNEKRLFIDSDVDEADDDQ